MAIRASFTTLFCPLNRIIAFSVVVFVIITYLKFFRLLFKEEKMSKIKILGGSTAVGTVLGMLFGLMLGSNMAIIVFIGAAIGFVVGALFDFMDKKKEME